MKLRVLGCTCATLAAVTGSPSAWADLGQDAVGVDVSGTPNGGVAVTGADLRLGFRHGMPRSAFIDRMTLALAFQPEVIAGLRFLPPAITGQRLEEQVERLGLGARLGWQLPRVEVWIYLHGSAAARSSPESALAAAAFWDLGAAFDYRFSASSLGVHVGGAFFDGSSWWEIGLHAETRFLP